MGKSNPNVSVLVSMYNKEDYIINSLDSVAIQKGFPMSLLELVVIDDFSEDISVGVAREFLESSGLQYKLICSNSRKGVSGSRNVLMDEAKGDFFVHLDGDDLLHEDCISKIYDAFTKNSEAEFIYSNHKSVRSDTKGSIPFLREIIEDKSPPLKQEFDVNSFLKRRYNYVGAVRAIKAVDAVPFDEDLPYAEDADWIINQGLKGTRFFYIPETLYYWRRDVRGISNSFSKEIANSWHDYVFDRGLKKLNDKGKSK